MVNKMLFAGIDSSSSSTGKRSAIAFCDETVIVSEIVCGTFSEIYNLALSKKDLITAFFVETAQTKRSWHGLAPATVVNIGMGLGAMKIMGDLLEHQRAPVFRIRLTHTKVDIAGFVEYTGFKGKTNEHGIDAGLVVVTGAEWYIDNLKREGKI